MKQIALLIVFTCMASVAFCQSTEAIPSIPEEKLVKAPQGSFEILPSKIEEAFTEEAWDEILVGIELRREEFNETYWQVTTFTRIKIKPRQSLIIEE